MNVLYSKANTLTLPYSIDGKAGNFTFIPGKNEIKPDVWRAIYLQHKERFDACYSRYLRVFQPSKTEDVVSEGNDSTVKIELGEESINFASLSIQTALDLIENTMEPDELKEYLATEKGQKRPRKAVIKAIEDKIEEIEQFDAKRNEGK